jgi:hypothetical protein
MTLIVNEQDVVAFQTTKPKAKVGRKRNKTTKTFGTFYFSYSTFTYLVPNVFHHFFINVNQQTQEHPYVVTPFLSYETSSKFAMKVLQFISLRCLIY